MEQKDNKKWLKPAYQVVAEVFANFLTTNGCAKLKQVQDRSSKMTNISTGKVYSELNGLLLAIDAVTKGYKSNVYGTIKQMNYAKRIIKAGEKATLILMIDESEAGKSVILRSVFNVEQTEAKAEQAS